MFTPIQGKQKQAKRTQTFYQFCSAKESILICTDVAARGLDIPAVDWIVQYDPPDDPKVCEPNTGLHEDSFWILDIAVSTFHDVLCAQFLPFLYYYAKMGSVSP